MSNLNEPQKLEILKFGKEKVKQNGWYYIDSKFTFTNHGAFGRVPKPILDKYHLLQIQMESSPDEWYRIKSYDFLDENKNALAKYLKVDEKNFLLCKNTTDGINIVLKSIQFETNTDVILATEYTYEPIMNTIDYISSYRIEEKNKIKTFLVPINLPILSKQAFINEFESMCKKIVEDLKLNIRLAMLDHVSSSLAALLPLKEIISIIRKWDKRQNTNIVIDAAHALGQINVNINEFDCDFYVATLHKWFLSPKGCAFIYFKDKQKAQQTLQPNYISYGYKKSVYLNFKQRASEDHISWFLIKDCIEFYEKNLGGINCITQYCSNLLDQAVVMLVESWNTCSFNLPKEMQAPLMRVIKLPPINYLLSNLEDSGATYKLTNFILREYKLIAYIVKIGKEFYVRISCFVYNSLEDFIRLKDVILEIREKTDI